MAIITAILTWLFVAMFWVGVGIVGILVVLKILKLIWDIIAACGEFIFGLFVLGIIVFLGTLFLRVIGG